MDGYLGVIVIVAVVALLAAGGLFLLFRPGRKAAPPVKPPEAPVLPEEEKRPAGAGEEAEGATTTLPPPVKPAEPMVVEPEVEVPPPSAGRMVRLRSRLARSQNALGRGLLELLSRDRLDDEVWDEIEESLITADVGVAPTRAMVEELRTKVKVLGSRTQDEVRGLLREQLLTQVNPDLDRTLHVQKHGERPAVVLVVGVNGTGKTTTTGKLARSLIGDGKQVVLGAADTFRAAAADQLQTWGERVGADTVRGPEGGDPASVAFDAVAKGIEEKVDVVIVDTAGRLHTKTGLMDELGKVKRVIEKKATVDEVLLVLDATTGQNGMRQAQVFAEVVNITGIALTKLDGTAKGGIVISVQRELGVPVKLVGLGEGPDDLAPFDPEVFVDAILGD
ncbi:signal recognition particle-docking protein FtsY [Nonomuraea gerenzanensis]|uniref:Signal recognition particle receptor FtsY n=1 Tax=Nonomuraea gerenzanensis TaxID=93944 RepID=A0A1M4ENF2_9ACTN|nr:signal recognition particle-docking protein FtsY [Nonomuraea gerenzanensis]UBU11875.1 signal recognition particle-docking protein FtsY [Nonomuraea gerenzanensis]SBP00386.1 Signal recognition particle receptor protein FtsY (=alpha subunit) (TC 3.A.5.1.1) [Nonomuraea gerenzanensis]